MDVISLSLHLVTLYHSIIIINAARENNHRLVNKTSIDMLICWTNDGTGIWIADAGEFSKSVLPCYFKHGNWQSFVRQLNRRWMGCMVVTRQSSTHSYCLSVYGFRKVCNTYTSGGVADNSSHQSDGWHFRHSYFRKGAEHLLQYVKRKRSGGGGVGGSSGQFNMKFVPPYTVPIGLVSSSSSSESNPVISSTGTIDHEGINVDDTRQNYAAAVASNALQTRLQLIEDNLRDMESRNAHVCSNLLEMQRIQTHQNQVNDTALHLYTRSVLFNRDRVRLCTTYWRLSILCLMPHHHPIKVGMSLCFCNYHFILHVYGKYRKKG